jgi:hypothetical protein
MVDHPQNVASGDYRLRQDLAFARDQVKRLEAERDVARRERDAALAQTAGTPRTCYSDEHIFPDAYQAMHDAMVNADRGRCRCGQMLLIAETSQFTVIPWEQWEHIR